ncbi:capsid protein [Crucivirus-158]|nr:capsid protein [Crucivirus-158]
MPNTKTATQQKFGPKNKPQPFHKKVWEQAYKKKNSWIRQGLKAGGSALGSLLGGPVGSSLGTSAGNLIANLVGAGAYRQGEIKMNTSFNKLPETGVLHAGVPTMHKVGSDIRVSHREYVCEVISSATANTFKVDKYPINPAMRNSFPWLSAVAQQYEQYKVHGMVFEFRSNSGNALNSTNTALGSVVMGASYRPSTTTPTNKQMIMNFEWANETVPSKDMIMGIECDPSSLAYKQYFTRGSNALPADDSVNQYDIANLFISTSGCQGTSVVLGSLFVSYDIELQHSIDSADIGQWLHQAKYNIPSQTISSSNAGLSPCLGALMVSDGIGLSVSGDTITFPIGSVGKYFINHSLRGSSATLGSWSFVLTNCTALNSFIGSSIGASMTPNAGVATGDENLEYTLTISDPAKIATFKFTNTALPSNWTSGEFFVIQLANSVF